MAMDNINQGKNLNTEEYPVISNCASGSCTKLKQCVSFDKKRLR